MKEDLERADELTNSREIQIYKELLSDDYL